MVSSFKDYPNRIVVIRHGGKDIDVKVYYFKEADSKGRYIEGNNQRWFIQSDLKLATLQGLDMYGKNSIGFYYQSPEWAKALFVKSNVSSTPQRSTGVSGSNNKIETSPFKVKPIPCGMCAVPGSGDRGGNGQCRTCHGRGTTYNGATGHELVCVNCQIKYETRGNGRCCSCNGTGWR